MEHLFSGVSARIGHAERDRDAFAVDLRFLTRQVEARIRQTEAERIVDLLRRAWDGLEIAVADENVVGIADVILRIVEIRGGRIVVERGCKCVRQFAGGRHVAAEDICLGHRTFHTTLPG